ncbi:MAG: rhomboid family intramembrane serine protease [Betaproteobacteria bacterium]|nr:rhomboid family intramembrane serine protease [Betaproteobacteria bacterium]MCL2886810.1 rhomboid family intramembrane serine protease [Betaproteobacteria bacterium]
MILMPYLRNVTRPHFPVGVILLVAINVLVFFGPQQRDEGRYRLAFEHYAQSVLPRLELPAYKDFLKKQRRAEDLKEFEKLERYRLSYALRRMDDDAVFMSELRAERVIAPEHEDYAQWREARAYFERTIDSITVERYAFRTDQPSLLTAFTHQFLHGSSGHLLGNMLVLILIAPAVEALLGTGLFLLVYLLGGLGAVATHWLIVGGGSGLVGASGAISAAMGAFAVLLRWRRIPFFYFVVVYFDIIRAPALLALPIWLVNEFVQLLWFGDRGVAYGAHFGGLVTGALLAWPFLARAESRFLPQGGEQAAEDNPQAAASDAFRRYLSEARRAMRGNDFERARRAYAKAAVQTAGGDLAGWRECFNVLKLSPGSAEFHQAARAFLRLKADDRETQDFIREVFRDYVAQAKPRPQLDAELLAHLGERFRRHGGPAELERVARLLHALAPNDPRSREIILAAASAHYGHGDSRRGADLTKLAEEAPPGG